MDTTSKTNLLKRIMVLNQFTIFLLVCLLLAGLTTVLIFSQKMVESEGVNTVGEITTSKDKYEIAKLDAEVKKIRSDTSGSLFWLQVIALFVTVGSAVGGYLIGQSNVTKQRLKFEHRKDIDSAFLAIVQELSSQEPILRASAAVRLGSVLQNFPAEWDVDDTRKAQLIRLSKQVLAAALAIEEVEKVLKTISIALVLDKTVPMITNPNGIAIAPDKTVPKPFYSKFKAFVKRLTLSKTDDSKIRDKTIQKTDDPKTENFSNVTNLDLSHANAIDAYWAKADFSYTDFYKATLSKASFKYSKLFKAQFRSAELNEAVLKYADCEGANFKMADLRGADLSNAKFDNAKFEKDASFKMADLRGADFSNAKLINVNFEGARVYNMKTSGVDFTSVANVKVDTSEEGDGTALVMLKEWLSINKNSKV